MTLHIHVQLCSKRCIVNVLSV